MNIKTLPTIDLVHILCQATDQGVINIIAYELACRIYVPSVSEKSFEEMLENFGYRGIKNNDKILRIK